MKHGTGNLIVLISIERLEIKTFARKILIFSWKTELLFLYSGDPLAIAAAQAAHEAKKRKWKQLGPDGKPVLAPIKQRKKVDRFDGIPEEEVTKKTLPDHLSPNLDIVIVSITEDS